MTYPNALTGGIVPESNINALIEQMMRAEQGYQDPAQQFIGPNALTQGVVNTPRPGARGFSPAALQEGRQFQPPDIAGFFQSLLSQPAPESAPLAAEEIVGMTEPAPKKKKGEFSEFFQLLQKAKAEKNEGRSDTKKAVRKLMKQLSEEAGNATGTIATS